MAYKLKILLVEDEAAALNFLAKAVLKCGENFDIVSEARNGQEALLKLKTYQVDLVITDINMPLMDGLKLSERISYEYPDIDVIITSGFQEFSFAQKAIAFGVKDYILKPLSSAKMLTVLSTVYHKKSIEFFQKKTSAFHQIVKKRAPFSGIDQRLLSLLQKDKYKYLLFNLGGSESNDNLVEAKVINFLSGDPEVVAFFDARSNNEYFVITSENFNLQVFFEDLVEYHDHFVTMIYSNQMANLDGLVNNYRKSLEVCDEVITLGKSQMVNADKFKNPIPQKIKDSKPFQRIEQSFINGNWSGLKRELELYLISLDIGNTPQKMVLRSLQGFVEFFETMINKPISLKEEFAQLVYSSKNEEELFNGLMCQLDKVIDDLTKHPDKIDSFEFFNLLKTFVDKNHAKTELTLSQTATHFAVSQTSLNEVFKKYGKKTFNEYLTQKRIEEATKEMEAMPQKSIKQIAESVGYQDPLYFSKVFKKLTGASPTVFLRSLKNG